MEIGKSATKAIVMLLTRKDFYEKSCRRWGGGRGGVEDGEI